MTHHENLKIITFVGLTGSGKSTAVEYFTEKGHPRAYFGGIVIQEVKDAGLEVNEENERTIRESLRESEGKDFIVKRIIKQIHGLADAGQHRIIADGLYSWTEYKALKHEFPGELNVVAIIAPRAKRYHRLATRPIRPLTEAEATSRDWAEIENLEKGGPIAMADYFVMNNGDLDNLTKQLDEIKDHLEF